ncbi:MAG: hypothetical protein VR70_02400 [Rhodospirillaceae bacterium BRH_c57]|nr:MAG: hypothetical protein VR70_02400 [Rhodospirillaceae bacterium BRH_c57]
MSSSFFTPGTYTNTTTLGQNLRVRSDISTLRSSLMEAQNQLASGFKATTHGGLGANATVAQELRHRMTRLEGYQGSISTVGMRLTTTQAGLGSIQQGSESLVETTMGVYAPGFKEAIRHSRVQAQSILSTSISVLNTSQGNRYLFSGADVSTKPVADTESMINGSGGRMGLKDVVALRLTADTGAAGKGRVATAEAANVVTVTHTGGMFGMRLSEITGPVGSVTAPSVTEPAVNTLEGTVDTTAVALGERVALSFEMPDGTTSTITMIAGTAPLPASPTTDTYYFEQGNGGSFDGVLNTALTTLVNREMTGASAVAAGNDFFDYEAPRIPDGAAATATGLAISSGTVVDWYVGDSSVVQVKGPATDPTALTPGKGDTYMVEAPGPGIGVWAGMEGMLATFNGTGWNFTKPEEGTRVIADAPTAGQPPHMYAYNATTGLWASDGPAPIQTTARDSVRAKVDDSLFVGHGVRADEPGIRDNLKVAALLLAADLDIDAPGPFQQVAEKMSSVIRDSLTGIISIQAELGVVQERMTALGESHKDFKATLNNQVLDVEGVDGFELSARLQDLLARLESSYQIVARMQSMNLSNYL